MSTAVWTNRLDWIPCGYRLESSSGLLVCSGRHRPVGGDVVSQDRDADPEHPDPQGSHGGIRKTTVAGPFIRRECSMQVSPFGASNAALGNNLTKSEARHPMEMLRPIRKTEKDVRKGCGFGISEKDSFPIGKKSFLAQFPHSRGAAMLRHSFRVAVQE